MTTYPTSNVAFRHVIEDGLSILGNEDIEPNRRRYVLDGLRNLIQKVTRGSELVKQQNLFVKPDDRKAYESFSFIERHLASSYNEQLISAAHTAFDRLSNNGANVPSDARDAAIKLLEELLSSIKREGNTGIPFEPQEIKLKK